jgi:hypothetical protein
VAEDDDEFGDIINFDHEDRQIMNLMKYYGLAQYPGLASVIRKLGSDTISIKPMALKAPDSPAPRWHIYSQRRSSPLSKVQENSQTSRPELSGTGSEGR